MIPITATDNVGAVVSGSLSIKVIPAGSSLFLGFTSMPADGFSTAGGDAVVIAGTNFIGLPSVNATYARADLGLSYTTSVCA